MNNEFAAMFSLIKSALTGQKVSLNSNINWDKIIKIAKLHQIVPIIFYGLKNSNIATPFDDKFFEITIQHIFIEQRQFNIIEEAKNAFEKNNIDFSILKGARLKKIYPKSEMRVMGDIDILIRPEQYFEVRQIMLQMNFKEGLEWNYECHWRKNDINLELHKRFYSNNNEKMYDYFDDIWQKLKPQKDCANSFEMTKEDEYIYIFLHLLKHYCAGGIGLRQFIDLYTFGLKHPQIDMPYVEKTLSQLGYFDFYKNVLKTIDCWFNGAKMDEITKAITIRTFKSGMFGNKDSNDMVAIVNAVKKSGNIKTARKKELFTVIFPSVALLKKHYPILKRAIVLLPFMWCARLISVVFKPKKIKYHTNRLKKFNEKNVLEFAEGLKKVGL